MAHKSAPMPTSVPHLLLIFVLISTRLMKTASHGPHLFYELFLWVEMSVIPCVPKALPVSRYVIGKNALSLCASAPLQTEKEACMLVNTCMPQLQQHLLLGLPQEFRSSYTLSCHLKLHEEKFEWPKCDSYEGRFYKEMPHTFPLRKVAKIRSQNICEQLLYKPSYASQPAIHRTKLQFFL